MQNTAPLAETVSCCPGVSPGLVCQSCECAKDVALRPSHTCYPYSGPLGGPDDPNKPVPLCDGCAEEHEAHWQEMWDGYYAGRL